MEHLNELKQKLVAKLHELAAVLKEAEAAYPDTGVFGVSAPLLDGIQTFTGSVTRAAARLDAATSVKDIQWQSLDVTPTARDLDQVGLWIAEGGRVRTLMEECLSLSLELYQAGAALGGSPVPEPPATV